jgi:uncharacterized protein (DUF305 family)
VTRLLLFAATAVSLVATATLAQHNHGQHGQSAPPKAAPGHSGHGGHAGPQQARMSPASKAFTEANAKMHRDMNIPFSGNADVDFARGMIPHHQGAIEMAEIVLKFGKDAEVKKLATEIISAQKREIAQMQAWLTRNGTQAAGGDGPAVIRAYQDINSRMHQNMSLSLTGNPDMDFIRGMVPHHDGAVEMARALLQFGKDPELRKLADDVIRTQNDEITVMKAWFQKNHGGSGHKH